MAQPQSGADLERTIRLRENKRRYRTRQKDYIASLEQRLRQARDEDIQATKEVQLCAQRVVRENERLKELLRHQGVDDSVIALWIRRDDDFIKNTQDEIKQDDSNNGPIIANEFHPIPSRPEPESLLLLARQAESSNSNKSMMGPPFAELPVRHTTCAVQTQLSSGGQ